MKVETDVLYGLCGRKATLNLNSDTQSFELCESQDGRPVSVDVKNNEEEDLRELRGCVKVDVVVLGSPSLK